MALPESSVSAACRSVVEFVRENFRALGLPVRVVIGTPAEAGTGPASSEHRINLFFNRFEPSGGGVDVLPGQPWYLRAHCLVTAFATAEDSVSAGENDLRLLGEVIRFFHEKPVMDAVTAMGEVIRIQLIFQALSLDDINRLWSSQKDVAYRPSVAYELALVPVVPRTRTLEGPRVASMAVQVESRPEPAALQRKEAWTPPVPRLRVETGLEDWAPLICFVRGEECSQSLSFDLGSPELPGFQPEVLVAGRVGATVGLRWDIWERQAGWRPVETGIDVDVRVQEVEPTQPPSTSRARVPLPFTDRTGQAALYAVRRYRRATGGELGPEIEVRSNPVMVTLYRGDV